MVLWEILEATQASSTDATPTLEVKLWERGDGREPAWLVFDSNCLMWYIINSGGGLQFLYQIENFVCKGISYIETLCNSKFGWSVYIK